MKKHTQGEWKERAKVILGCETNEEYREINAGDGFYSYVTNTGFSLTGYVSPADSKLIAAAPDLLEALEFLFEHIDWDKQPFSLRVHGHRITENAIQKATT